jgi:hypothetical protein
MNKLFLCLLLVCSVGQVAAPEDTLIKVGLSYAVLATCVSEAMAGPLLAVEGAKMGFVTGILTGFMIAPFTIGAVGAGAVVAVSALTAVAAGMVGLMLPTP